MYGTVASVEIRLAGSWLLGAHAAGVSTLQVQDVSDLPDDGGRVVIDGNAFDYIDITDTSDPDATAPNDTITLAAPLVSGYPANTPVTLYPARPYKLALVVLDGDDEAVECLVVHALFDRLTEGPRQLDAGETVHVTQRAGDAMPLVDDLIGKVPTVDASYITAGTLQSSAVDQAEWVDSGTVYSLFVDAGIPLLPGPPGADGAEGPEGPPGGSYLAARWQFSTTLTTPPSSGQLRMPTALDNMYLNETDSSGFNRAVGLDQMNVGDLVTIKDTSNNRALLRVRAAQTDNGTWRTIPVTLKSGNLATMRGGSVEVSVVLATADDDDIWIDEQNGDLYFVAS